MEAVNHAANGMHLFSGIILLLIGKSMWVECSHISCEVNARISAVDLNKLNCSAIVCAEKYVTQSYFKTRKKYLNSDFKQFIEHKLFSLPSSEAYFGDLNDSLGQLMLDRHLIGEGFHRQLFSSVKLELDQESLHFLSAPSCQAILIEKLPLGVFADPFELERFFNRGDVAVFGDANLEAPTILSAQTLVEIHIDLNTTPRESGALKMDVKLPLHARYPPLNEGHEILEFGEPNFLIRCTRAMSQTNFLFKRSDYNVKNITISWHMPSGKKSHATIVSVATIASALLSAAIIIRTIYHPHMAGHPKQS